MYTNITTSETSSMHNDGSIDCLWVVSDRRFIFIQGCICLTQDGQSMSKLPYVYYRQRYLHTLLHDAPYTQAYIYIYIYIYTRFAYLAWGESVVVQSWSIREKHELWVISSVFSKAEYKAQSEAVQRMQKRDKCGMFCVFESSAEETFRWCCRA